MATEAHVLDAPVRRQRGGAFWLLALVPLLLLGVVLTYVVVTGGGLKELAGPPVERVTVSRVALPQPGIITVDVVNDGPQAVTIAQVQVDDAYFGFEVTPDGTIPRLGHATFTIYYPWVEGEAHVIALVSSLGVLFQAEVPVAVQAPTVSRHLFLLFGLVGLYVGIVPIGLGMLWFPFLRRLGDRAMSFVLALTVGLLLYLAVGTWLDAVEIAAGLPVFWQGVPLVVFVALLTLGILLAVGSRRRVTKGRDPAPRGSDALGTSYRIAFGIGLHNLGEGLAIGAAFALGEAALGTFLILGFTLHNITEGVGIVAPVVRRGTPPLRHFVWLLLVAGGPAIVGTWLGGFAFDPVLATIFLAIGVGAILQVVWEVGKLVARDSQRAGLPTVGWSNLAGLAVGIALMYFTAFLVKA